MNDTWKAIVKISLKLVVKLIEVLIGTDIDGDGECGTCKKD